MLLTDPRTSFERASQLDASKDAEGEGVGEPQFSGAVAGV